MSKRVKENLICACLWTVLIALAFIFILTAINKPTSGTIYKKEFTPEHTTTYMQPISTGKVITLHPRHQLVPDTYEFYIKNDDKTNTIEVTKEVYESFSIGDYYELEE